MGKIVWGLGGGEMGRELVSDPGEASLCGVLWRLVHLVPGETVGGWLHGWLMRMEEWMATPQEKQAFFEAVCGAAGAGGGGRGVVGGREERREFYSMVWRFAVGCRANARRWRRKGG